MANQEEKKKRAEVEVNPSAKMTALQGQIRAVFMSCQEDDVSVTKSVNRFRKLLDPLLLVKEDEAKKDRHARKKERQHFLERFLFYLQLPLVVKERTSYVERCLEVVCRLAVSYLQDEEEAKKQRKKEAVDRGEAVEEDNDEDDDEIELPWLLSQLFHWLLDHHEVEGSQARWRICLLLNRLLKLMGPEACIDEELYQKIYDNMLLRMKDKVAEIRSQAVTALQRLQDPRDESCPILKAFFFHMAKDPSAGVRRTVVRCIGASRLTLPHVLKRTLDVDESVRKQAFKFVSEKVHLRSLTIGQREQVLKRGLTDRSEGVKIIVERDLVPAWLRLCNNSIVELLYALDVGNSDGKIGLDTLNLLFKNVPYKELLEQFQFIDDNKLIPYEKLTVETAVYWRGLAAFLLNEGGGALDILDKLLPELTQFCHYVRHYALEIEKPEDDVGWMFVAKQLIEMTNLFDLADEVGRSNLGQLSMDLMAHHKVPIVFVEPLMAIFTAVRTNADARIQEVAEIIAELRDPMKADEEEGEAEDAMAEEGEASPMAGAGKKTPQSSKKREEEQRKKQVQISKVRLQRNMLKEDLDDAIQNKDFARAEIINREMNELNEEENRLQDMLTEASAMAARPVTEEKAAEVAVEAEENVEDGALEKSAKPGDDPMVMRKCLDMIFYLLQDPSIKSLNATLLTLLEELVLPAIRNLDAESRKSAVRALGVCSLRSLDVARQQLLLMFQIAHLDSLEVRVQALAMVIDQLMWHGLPAFITVEGGGADQRSNIDSVLDSEVSSEQANQRTGHNLTQNDLNTQGGNSVVAILTRLLDDPDVDIQTKATEGLCKLLMIGAISSAKLFQRLILMWYNPLTESNGKLRHILGTFFPLYASMSRANQDVIEESMLPTLKTLFKAPPSSPLATIDVDDLGLFFIQLTREDFLQAAAGDKASNEGPSPHDSIAFSLSNEIISLPNSFYVKTLVKLFQNLNLTPNDFVKLRELRKLHDEILRVVHDKQALRGLEKISANLTDMISKDPNIGQESEEAEEQPGEQQQQQPEEPPQEGEHNNSFSSMNSTKAKRRMLFSHSHTTLLEEDEDKEKLLPDNLIEEATTSTGSSSADDNLFLPPPNPPPAKKAKQVVVDPNVTKIEESSDEDDDEELVSGNFPGRSGLLEKQKQQVQVVVQSASSSEEEGVGDRRTVAETPSNDDDENDDDIFKMPSQPPVTSTQTSSESAASAPAAAATSSSEEDDGVLSTFYDSQAGKKSKKLRKAALSTTDEDEEEVVEAEGRKRAKRNQPSSSPTKQANVEKASSTQSKRKTAVDATPSPSTRSSRGNGASASKNTLAAASKKKTVEATPSPSARSRRGEATTASKKKTTVEATPSPSARSRRGDSSAKKTPAAATKRAAVEATPSPSARSRREDMAKSKKTPTATTKKTTVEATPSPSTRSQRVTATSANKTKEVGIKKTAALTLSPAGRGRREAASATKTTPASRSSSARKVQAKATAATATPPARSGSRHAEKSKATPPVRSNSKRGAVPATRSDSAGRVSKASSQKEPTPARSSSLRPSGKEAPARPAVAKKKATAVAKSDSSSSSKSSVSTASSKSSSSATSSKSSSSATSSKSSASSTSSKSTSSSVIVSASRKKAVVISSSQSSDDSSPVRSSSVPSRSSSRRRGVASSDADISFEDTPLKRPTSARKAAKNKAEEDLRAKAFRQTRKTRKN